MIRRVLKAGAAFVVCALTVLAVTAIPAKAAVKASGTWNSCKWELTDDGKLTVYPGIGSDAFEAKAQWGEYADEITSVAFVQEKGKKVIAAAYSNDLFSIFTKVTSFDFSGLDTSYVKDMSGMFAGCAALKSLDLSGFDTSDVTDMHSMFNKCEKLKTLDLSGFDTSNVVDMSGMFNECWNLSSLNLSGWDTSKVEDMSYMFRCCDSFTTLDLSSFNTSKVQNMDLMFNYSSNLEAIYVDPAAWSTDAVISSEQMFKGCKSLVGGDGTAYSEGFDDAVHARVGDDVNPGYLTDIASLYDLANATVSEIPDQTYTGKALVPEVTVTIAGKTLTAGYDYEVAYADNTKVGTAKVTITGIGGYTNKVETSFKINPADLAGATVTVADQAYTGKALTPAVTVTFDGATLTENTDYTVAYANNTKIGTATVTVTGKGNCTGTATATFKIKPPAHDPGWAQFDGDWYYYKNDKSLLTKAWLEYKGVWYYFAEDGKLVVNGWAYYKGGTYYMGSNGQLAKNVWAKVDGVWYYIGSDSKPVKNTWVKSSGIWYYLGSDGKLLTDGWVKYNGAWYYMGSSGALVTSNWVKYNDAWYYMGSDGKLVTNGWVSYKGTWYYMGSSGSMLADAWVKYKGTWYYMGSDGSLLTNGWVEYNGSWYYMDASGSLAVNTWILYKGTYYHLNGSGVWDKTWKAS